MVLVDTSVLIDFLRGQKNKKVSQFEEILEKQIPWGINEFIFQELLQWARDQKEFSRLRAYFNTIPLYSLKHGKSSFEYAALLNLQCREKGVAIRSTIDLLVAQTAIENEMLLLHNDSDFDRLGKVIKKLRIY